MRKVSDILRERAAAGASATASFFGLRKNNLGTAIKHPVGTAVAIATSLPAAAAGAAPQRELSKLSAPAATAPGARKQAPDENASTRCEETSPAPAATNDDMLEALGKMYGAESEPDRKSEIYQMIQEVRALPQGVRFEPGKREALQAAYTAETNPNKKAEIFAEIKKARPVVRRITSPFIS